MNRELVKSIVLSTLAGRAESGTERLRAAVYKRADGLCECTMKTCNHHGARCNAPLGRNWELHRVSSDSRYTLTNVIATCETCQSELPIQSCETCQSELPIQDDRWRLVFWVGVVLFAVSAGGWFYWATLK
jgi:hypothetical protein